MERLHDHIDKLISRSLDGELTDAEQLELNRELIRNPEANRMMEMSRRIDVMASEALLMEVGTTDSPIALDTLPPQEVNRRSRRWGRGRWLIPGAMAAAVAAFFLAQPDTSLIHPPQPSDFHSNVPLVESQGMNPVVTPVSSRGSSPDLMRRVGTGPRITRDTGREIFGVVGDDGNIYWIEVDRSVTFRRPMRAAALRGRADGI